MRHTDWSYDAPGPLFTRSVAQYDSGFDNVLDVYISYLRAKIENAVAAHPYGPAYVGFAGRGEPQPMHSTSIRARNDRHRLRTRHISYSCCWHVVPWIAYAQWGG